MRSKSKSSNRIVIDNYSRRILAWKTSAKFDTSITAEVLIQASDGWLTKARHFTSCSFPKAALKILFNLCQICEREGLVFGICCRIVTEQLVIAEQSRQRSMNSLVELSETTIGPRYKSQSPVVTQYSDLRRQVARPTVSRRSKLAAPEVLQAWFAESQC